jgi:6-phosphogluconolactonase/glucosamine-6-phosphate isomerase/deaminase
MLDMEVKRNRDAKDVAHHISSVVARALGDGESVLLLVPGGSAITVAVMVADDLRAVPDTSRLTVMLTDERYGDVGHSDSNWRQMHDRGFTIPGATLIPTLRGVPFHETVSGYGKDLETQMNRADVRIGLFGMGADGHTAGILPESPASTSTRYAEGYQAPPYSRITMTPLAIGRMDVAVLYAMGKEKAKAMRELMGEKAITEEPAQALKNAGELTIFTDAV